MEGTRGHLIALVAALTLPILGLVLLLTVPDLDVMGAPSLPFLLVLGVAVIDAVLGFAMGEAASRRDDGRLFLVSLVLLASAGFLALHALATPEVLIEEPNSRFVIATPIGLFPPPCARRRRRCSRRAASGVSRSARRWIRWSLLALMVGWAVASLAGAPFLRRPAPSEAPLSFRIAAPMRVALYAFAAVRYLAITAVVVADHCRSPSPQRSSSWPRPP